MSELLSRARQHESNRDLETAFTLYKEALTIFIQQSKTTRNPVTLQHLKSQINEVLTHTENLKQKINEDKAKQQVNRTIIIEENSKNHDLSDIFTPYLENCTRVIISDPYLGKPHQVRVLHYLCEILYKHDVKMLIIETNPESSASDELKSLVKQFTKYIQVYLITTSLLHDREITFYETPKAGQGEWIARLGRGLDFYKRIDKYEPGWQNYGLRPCKECTIEVYYKNFDLREFNKLRELLHKIKQVGVDSKRIYDENKHRSGFETLLDAQIERLDGLVIPSNYRYAKAVKKETINAINGYSAGN